MKRQQIKSKLKFSDIRTQWHDYVKNVQESRKFAEIDKSYVTDKSVSDSCGNEVKWHKLSWYT